MTLDRYQVHSQVCSEGDNTSNKGFSVVDDTLQIHENSAQGTGSSKLVKMNHS